MFNPFTEVAEGDPADAELVKRANNGDRTALERLVLRHQAWIYNIAVRMVSRCVGLPCLLHRRRRRR